MSESAAVLQFPSVGSSDFTVPVIAVFLQTLSGTLSVVVIIHIDESVSLLHFGRGTENDIDRSPGILSSQIHTVSYRFLHLFNMSLQIVNLPA